MEYTSSTPIVDLFNFKIKHKFTRCPSDIHSWNWHCDEDDDYCEKGVQDIATASKEISGRVQCFLRVIRHCFVFNEFYE